MVNRKEIIISEFHSVECSGKNFPLDHPKIYLEIPDQERQAICPYCSKTFILQDHKSVKQN